MNPLLLLALAQGATGLISGIMGGSELKKAKALEAENARPTETVPQGVLDATALARHMANMGMPAEQYNQILQQIQRGGTTALASARDRRSSLDVTSTVQQAMNDAQLSLGAKSSEMKQQNQQTLISTLQNLGSWQDKIWQWNSGQKFMENAAAIRALKGAGNANINTMFDSILSAGATAATGLSGNKGATAGGIDLAGITGGINTNKSTLEAGKPTTFEDPTITSPELFSNGTPDAFMNYLIKLKSLSAAA